MSTMTDRPPGGPPANEPFFYGWRDVVRVLPDGTEVDERIALTEEDVLHPQEGDHIVLGDPHEIDRMYLRGALTSHLADRPGVVVVTDLAIYWDVPDGDYHCPDVTVLGGVAERRLWSSFDMAEEGGHPILVIEITSPSTRHVDLELKVEAYLRVGVPFYVIVDAQVRHDVRHVRFLGRRATSTGWVEVPVDERGWLWLEPVGLWLKARDGQVACCDAQGREIEDFTGQVQARAAAEREVAVAAEAREVEARARAAAEERAAAEAQARAAAEAQAAAEVQARQALEARVRELEEQLRKATGSP